MSGKMKVLILTDEKVFTKTMTSVPIVGETVHYQAKYVNEHDLTLFVTGVSHCPTITQIIRLAKTLNGGVAFAKQCVEEMPVALLKAKVIEQGDHWSQL